MEIFAVAGARLDRVADRMTEVQRLAESILALIGRNDSGLVRERASDDVFERRELTRENRVEAPLEISEHRGVHDRTILDDFGKTLAKFARGQSRERRYVGNDQSRVKEGTDS